MLWRLAALAAIALPARSQVVFDAPVPVRPASVFAAVPATQPPALDRPPAPLTLEASIAAGSEAPRGRPERSSLRSLESLVVLLKARLDATPDPAAFSPGDVAILGAKSQAVSVTIRGETLSGRLPTLVRIHDASSSGEPAIDLPLSRSNGRGAVLTMGEPPEKLRFAPLRPVEKAVSELRAEILPRLSFKKGELVRVRDMSTGRIERMTYMGRHRSIRDLFREVEERGLLVRDTNGETWSAPRRVVFKDAGVGEPITFGLAARPQFTWAPFENPAGVIRSFLDGAAWLGSHPEFLAAPHEQRWKALAGYINAVMRPGNVAQKAEFLDLGFPELLRLGVGVCRHSATLMTAVLREAGYDARIMSRFEKTDGRAWTEVRGPCLPAGRPQGSSVETWIFDLTNEKILSWTEAEAQAAASADSMAARWYVHPGRAEYPPSPRVPE
jgi:hypothetical protein